EKYPPTVLEFLRIPGLGPKTIAAILGHFRISTLVELERLARDHHLQDLPRMGAKLEEKILKGIAHYRQSAGRFLLSFATDTAESMAAYLEGPGVESVTPAGSVRRGKETIGDVDLLVTGADAAQALGKFLQHPSVHEVLAQGENKASARVGIEGLQVDVRALPRENFGAALQYFTGSKEHNIVLRQRALRQGLTLNEYGLTRIDGGAVVASRTEEEIYAALGLPWIAPELRENQGEIEAAERNELPTLIELSDIRGDLHMHTTESDGRATLEEMAAAAHELGYEYIVITDHSKALAMANGLDEKRAVEFAHRVRELRDRLPLRVFSGLECDILRDGTMDLADDALAELDFVIASVHSYQNLEAPEMTARLMKALDNPHVKAIGHPTGRMLLHREPFPFDFELIARESARRGVALEINASPERLDLHASLIRTAKAAGCRFIIDTDAHHPRHLRHMRYGVKMARRGWLAPGDVLNCLPLAKFEAAIRR
ncbi:MAG: DNA polymerase/3'-5' exonuclease PolX, partial [Bryobacteraceae bacterium]|nr:DNA polymerase/3'-5' exonuclease PolX [Bryobacteraceae bacterium]